jgi:hypothetical protein
MENITHIHFKVAKVGITKKTGVRSEKHLKQIFDEFKHNVDEHIDLHCHEIYERHCSFSTVL